MTAPTPTPEDVARLVMAARAVDLMFDVRAQGRWLCGWCRRSARAGEPVRAIPHERGCIVAAYRAALAPFREEDRDG